jgi:hypothetical protein
MTMKKLGAFLATVTVTAAIAFAGGAARAQPVPDVPLPADITGAGSGSGSGDQPANTGGNTPPIPSDKDKPIGPTDPYPPPPPPKPKLIKPPLSAWCPWRGRGTECLPEVLTTPTGWLLPNGMLYSKTSVDTGGGISSDTRVGLGDVAEFGVSTTDQVREKTDELDQRISRIQPYVLASFRIGVPESRIFNAQPGLTLGFRKSFERNHEGFKSRIAELTLVQSKHVHKNVAIHVGGAFWDASLTGPPDETTGERPETTLHDLPGKTISNQVRLFGGVEVRPLENSQILVDLGWVPQFCYNCVDEKDKVSLKPVLSWGVRTMLSSWARFEAGVRLPDIGKANLLDAQIFGSLTLTSGAFRSAIESLQ